MPPNEDRASLSGTVNIRGEALVDVEVIGPAARFAVSCIVDTGFTGTLVLPVAVASNWACVDKGPATVNSLTARG